MLRIEKVRSEELGVRSEGAAQNKMKAPRVLKLAALLTFDALHRYFSFRIPNP